MATREQIEALKIDENVFELAEDTELEYLVHFAAPFTGGDKCLVPKGTAFAPHSPMRGDALYMHLVDEDNEELYAKMEAQVKVNYENLFTRLQDFRFSSQKHSSKHYLSNSVVAAQSAYWKSYASCVLPSIRFSHKGLSHPA